MSSPKVIISYLQAKSVYIVSVFSGAKHSVQHGVGNQQMLDEFNRIWESFI